MCVYDLLRRRPIKLAEFVTLPVRQSFFRPTHIERDARPPGAGKLANMDEVLAREFWRIWKNVLAVVLAGGKVHGSSRSLAIGPSRPSPSAGATASSTSRSPTASTARSARMLVLTQYKAMQPRPAHQPWAGGFLQPRNWASSSTCVPPQQRIDENVVPGHRRRRLPKHLHHREGTPRNTSSSWRATTSTRWTTRTMVAVPHRQPEADVTVGALPVDWPTRRASFGVMADRPDDTASSGFRRRSRDPATIPGDPTHCLGVDGHLRVHRPVPVRAALPSTRPAATAATTSGKNIIPAHDRHAHGCSPIRSATRTARPTPTGATSARSTPTTKRTWTSSRSTRVLNLYDDDWPIAHATSRSFPPPKFVFTGEGPRGHARRGERLDSIVCPGSIIVRAARRPRSILSLALPGQQLTARWWKIRSCFEGVDIGRLLPRPPRDHRQGRPHPGGNRDRLQPRTRPSLEASRLRRGIVVIAKADGVEQFHVGNDADWSNAVRFPWLAFSILSNGVLSPAA